MKIRSGFVSNSSSSSFIVPVMNDIKDFDYSSLRPYFNVRDNYRYDSKIMESYYINLPILTGNRSFEWEVCTYSGFVNKLNYLLIQIESLDDSSRIKYDIKSKLENALQSICKKAYGLSEKDHYTFEVEIDYNYLKYDSIYDWYSVFNIDHQSTWQEKSDCVEKYFSVNKPDSSLIENYLIGSSYIQGGNDNEDMPEEYHNSYSIYENYVGNFWEKCL